MSQLTEPFFPKRARQHLPFGCFHSHCYQLRCIQSAKVLSRTKRGLTREAKRLNMPGKYPSDWPSLHLSEVMHKMWLSQCRKEANWTENTFQIQTTLSRLGLAKVMQKSEKEKSFDLPIIPLQPGQCRVLFGLSFPFHMMIKQVELPKCEVKIIF